jgi:hypothetical protein
MPAQTRKQSCAYIHHKLVVYYSNNSIETPHVIDITNVHICWWRILSSFASATILVSTKDLHLGWMQNHDTRASQIFPICWQTLSIFQTPWHNQHLIAAKWVCALSFSFTYQKPEISQQQGGGGITYLLSCLCIRELNANFARWPKSSNQKILQHGLAKRRKKNITH